MLFCPAVKLIYGDLRSVPRSLSTRCYSLQTTYLIYEDFQILLPTALLIFTAAKLFYQLK